MLYTRGTTKYLNFHYNVTGQELATKNKTITKIKENVLAKRFIENFANPAPPP